MAAGKREVAGGLCPLCYLRVVDTTVLGVWVYKGCGYKVRAVTGFLASHGVYLQAAQLPLTAPERPAKPAAGGMGERRTGGGSPEGESPRQEPLPPGTNEEAVNPITGELGKLLPPTKKVRARARKARLEGQA